MTTSWSPARSTTWRTCPRQFLLRDVLGAEPAQHETLRRRRGRVMHAGMEAAFRTLFSGKHRGALSMAWYIGEAHEAMKAHPDAQTLPTPELMDCLQIVSSLLATLDVPGAGSILGIEHPFTFLYKGIPINGIVDLALRTGKNSLRIIDWKSGHIPDRPEQLEGNTALCVYSIAAKRAWPWAGKIEVGLHSLRYAESNFVEVTREMQKLALDRLERDYKAAEYARAQLAEIPVDDAFPVRSGQHCTDCRFRSYCPLFAASSPPVRPGVDVAAERARLEARISQPG